MNTKPSPFGSGFLGLEAPVCSFHDSFIAVVLGVLCLAAITAGVNAAPADGPNNASSSRIKVHRTVPRVELPDTALRFSAEPKTHEIADARVFSEPLVSTGGEPDATENQAVGRALLRHNKRTDTDDVSHLGEFLSAHPRGKWSASVLYNLGMDYCHSGYWSKALAALENSWNISKDATDPKAKALADRAGGELAMLYARLGYTSQLDALLKSFEARTVIGSATERIAGARQGLWSMQHTPWISFRCGPLALDRIRAVKDPNLAANAYIQDSHATTNGYSLTQLQQLSRDLGMFYQIALRQRGAEFLTPSIVHFKLNHYAALIRKDGSHYLIKDPTFGNDLWITSKALEEECSGYFLVPRGPLPTGWRAVNDAEGATIWGKGATSNNDPNDTTPDDDKKDQCPVDGGMAVANVHLMAVSLNIMDTPVGYRPPVGPPVYFTATYNQREANQPANFSYSNLGPKWTFNWIAYIKDNPGNPLANVEFYVSGGGTELFSGFNSNSQTFAVQIRSQAQLKRTSTNSYEMLFPDGSKKLFSRPDGAAGAGRRVFLSQVLDPAGNAVELTYDARFRIVAIRDAIGQVTTLGYGYAPDTNKITSVVDPFGRYASFDYDSSGRLTNITDVIGLNSKFTYEGGSDFIQALTTPYGTTRFAKGESGRTRWLETTDPLGGTDRVEYSENTNVGLPNSEPASVLPQGMFLRNRIIYARNTFYWDKKAYAEARGDYTKAKIYHWLHTEDYSSAAGVLESIKMPFENRVWFNYDGQPQNDEGATVRGTSDKPTKVGRVLDDGTTQLNRYEYNFMGKIVKSIDPVGRTMTYSYASNGIDLLEVRQTTGGQNDLLSTILYNDLHMPISITDAAMQVTTNTYNARGQVLSTTSPRQEAKTYNYDTNGFLLGIDGPLPGPSDTTTFTYDDIGRVKSMIEPDAYALTFSYDNLDRPTSVTYPDGSSESFTYDRLDRVLLRDRQGRESRLAYNARRELVSTIDPLRRTNQFEWCECSGLTSFIDAIGRTTRWEYDVQGRLREKRYADGAKITYTYESTTSRLKSIEDEKGQLRLYEYHLDNQLRRSSYPNAVVPTPSVTFAYDTNYNRLRSMQDSLGTTVYSYYPVGALGALRRASVDGPWFNDTVAYRYDEVGRVVQRSINGIPQTYSYDGLNRATSVSNVLGNFAFSYDGPTTRLREVGYPNGQKVQHDYYNAFGDRRLQELRQIRPDSSVQARFGYAYDAAGNITNWLQQAGGSSQTWVVGYDDGDQLREVTVTEGASIIQSYGYGYDAAGNRLFEETNGVRRTFAFNALNEVTTARGASATGSFEWDAEHRIVAIVKGTHRTEFTHDGWGRRCRIVEKENGAIQSEKRLVWSKFEVCEERDASGAITTKRFFTRGLQDLSSGLPRRFFYTRDHLASIREVSDESSSVQAGFSYEPFGTQKRTGSGLSDFGFGGYYQHIPSQLWLTVFRAYDPGMGRWLSRDPIMESGGPNLFGYAENNPIGKVDTLGLTTMPGLPGFPGTPGMPGRPPGIFPDDGGKDDRDKGKDTGEDERECKKKKKKKCENTCPMPKIKQIRYEDGHKHWPCKGPHIHADVEVYNQDANCICWPKEITFTICVGGFEDDYSP